MTTAYEAFELECPEHGATVAALLDKYNLDNEVYEILIDNVEPTKDALDRALEDFSMHDLVSLLTVARAFVREYREETGRFLRVQDFIECCA